MALSARTASKQPAWLRAIGRALSGLLVLAVLVIGWFVYREYYANPRTDDAYVRANTASLAAHVSGQIIKLPIKDNQFVKNGDLLFVVDPRPYKLALDSARTKLNLTTIEIKTLNDTIGSANAQLVSARLMRQRQTILDRIVCPRTDFVTDNEVVDARNKLRRRSAAASSEYQRHRMRWNAGDVNQRVRAAQKRRGSPTELRLLFRAALLGLVTNPILRRPVRNTGQPVLTLIDDRNWRVLAYWGRLTAGHGTDVALLSYPGLRLRERQG